MCVHKDLYLIRIQIYSTLRAGNRKKHLRLGQIWNILMFGDSNYFPFAFVFDIIFMCKCFNVLNFTGGRAHLNFEYKIDVTTKTKERENWIITNVRTISSCTTQYTLAFIVPSVGMTHAYTQAHSCSAFCTQNTATVMCFGGVFQLPHQYSHTMHVYVYVSSRTVSNEWRYPCSECVRACVWVTWILWNKLVCLYDSARVCIGMRCRPSVNGKEARQTTAEW